MTPWSLAVFQALDDNIPEERQLYQLTLTGVSEGAELNQSMLYANITMAASDFPFGRFSFSQEFLQASEEDRQVRGSLWDLGFIEWKGDELCGMRTNPDDVLMP